MAKQEPYVSEQQCSRDAISLPVVEILPSATWTPISHDLGHSYYYGKVTWFLLQGSTYCNHACTYAVPGISGVGQRAEEGSTIPNAYSRVRSQAVISIH